MSKTFREVHLVLPMEPNAELRAGDEASAMARAVEMSADKIDELRMAVLEACINALEHSDSPDQKIFVTLSLLGSDRPEKVQVTVRDRGRGFEPDNLNKGPKVDGQAPRKRGWGLSIIRGLMDELEIDSGQQGTSVIMSKRI